MSYFITPSLGLQLADPLTIQSFETTNVNSNFMLLESGIVADRVRLTAVEGRATVIEGGASRGTLTDYTTANLTTLDAIANALIGDIAYVVAPGTGISGLRFVAWQGAAATIDWRPAEVVQATTVTNLANFATAINAISDLALQTGTMGQVANEGFPRRWNGSFWKPFGSGLLPVVPTSAVGGTVGTDGVVTFSNQASIEVRGCFTSDFDNYLIIFDWTTPLAGTQTLQFGSAGVLYTAANYSTHIAQFGAAYAETGATGASILLNNAGSLSVVGEVKVFGPQNVSSTRVTSDIAVDLTATTHNQSLNAGKVNVTNQFTDAKITFAGSNGTGSMRVYGYNDN